MKQLTPFVLYLLTALLTGCGQLELGVEPTRTSLPRFTPAVMTVIATPTLKGETAVSPSPTPTPTPTSTPLPTTTPTATSGSIPFNPPSATATPVPPPQILAFTARPSTIEPGDTLTLEWESQGDSAQLCLAFPGTQAEAAACNGVALSGSQSLTVADRYRTNFNLELHVTRQEQVTTALIPISVTCSEAWWFFTPTPPVCPAQESISSNAAAQYFEQGWMVWIEELSTIYVFFADGTYAAFADPLAPDTAETGDGGVTPPAGLYAPIRGFGLLWRGEAFNAAGGWIRDQLGWGLAPEFGFETVYQQQAAVSLGPLFFTDPGNNVVRLNLTQYQWTFWSE